ncbi:deoxyguanosinetriphosphate triphosphohydrolase [Clostridium saccharobutylicum]|uniref:Deoxyguanosinetriphosphate triphosphohydrolase-like protein n=1 Tax=Clostridium saccharobutylicum DSM 13864 TaxID=1345695 RepID=U5MNL9_CLOSA|nr:deoxyguanosinetriphosphate triphosphohydrolase [Clostridium saccharobutylicum]AGX42113.1 deoxyguanosinetriphosphate triphosphohydrolase-like protein [Clostridium saccharobutylicum DSM 13864]AQR89390.1 deoxyguanosinetriphosphate triphosphohydrolase [Clostridium saccharobutylicum]AQR99292.1 deoxyguanosinetriphosphate triphosphohydrolase [Clostridium saccharobutylicum]AQS13278.1 deoxyguanosinetriphosphate triphosphohydrolase [Clostridium saccharobutylicum]MBA2904534.1 dGTPase [Clostridium sacc
MNIREKIQSFESLTLIKEAAFSSNSLGRKIKEKDDDIRTCYMVDRDRIIQSKSFRRLKHKTQVYIKTSGDHYRTRLTHTLEVAQVARNIGVGIGLNENLIEAIALGHDLGHVAFAHTGEEVLNGYLEGGFRHNEQSARVVTKLENDGKGLNLTQEVINGIINHSGLGTVKDIITLEGVVVKVSDKMAYLNHDIDDSIRAGLLRKEDLPKDIVRILGDNSTERLNTLIKDFIKTSNFNIKNGIKEVGLSKEINEAMIELRKYMFKNIYLGNTLKVERNKAKFILSQLIKYFENNPNEMPDIYVDIVEKEGLQRGVADYIAGMSDDYCLLLFNRIFVPKVVIDL